MNAWNAPGTALPFRNNEKEVLGYGHLLNGFLVSRK